MWDIFCSVIDNYGDAGVSWRLARVLRRDHGIPIRLWVDDLRTLARLAPQVDPHASSQEVDGVAIHAWREPFVDTVPGEVVIEAFGCRLPETYVRAMAERSSQPVWLNLEYLSAEDWARDCHLAPSQHPRLPLRKHFFFPGFDVGTGGLLRERELPAARRAFQDDAQARARFWAAIGVPTPTPGERRVSLFCYDNPALSALLDAWSLGDAPISVLVPEGPAVARITAHWGCAEWRVGEPLRRGVLSLYRLPFSDQAQYDRLLWACDVNFVRGEDSFVRAQWAARPLVWHIYPQEEGAHLPKLAAFLDCYGAGLAEAAAESVRGLHAAWNGAPEAPDIGAAWNRWVEQREVHQSQAQVWAQLRESGPELAAELVKFAQGQVK